MGVGAGDRVTRRRTSWRSQGMATRHGNITKNICPGAEGVQFPRGIYLHLNREERQETPSRASCLTQTHLLLHQKRPSD